MIPARYFDGRSSRPRPATLSATGDGLRIATDDRERVVPRDAVTLTRSTGRSPSRIALADGGLCEIDDAPGVDVLFDALGHRPGFAERLGSRMSRVIAVAIAFVALSVAFYLWGIPIVANVAIDHAPRSFDDALGGRVLATLDAQRVFRPTALPVERRDRILARFARLHLPPEGIGLRVLFRRLGVPNALAFPDGTIVLSDELVELAGDDDDAIATVLAHEVGHVVHRDAMRAVARNALASVMATWYFGDVSTGAALLAGNLGGLRFSREAEHAADLYALRVMRASGIATHGAAELFRRLEDWTPPKKADAPKSDDKPADDGRGVDETKKGDREHRHLAIPEYLSTHPATDGRIQLFDGDGPIPSS